MEPQPVAEPEPTPTRKQPARAAAQKAAEKKAKEAEEAARKKAESGKASASALQKQLAAQKEAVKAAEAAAKERIAEVEAQVRIFGLVRTRTSRQKNKTQQPAIASLLRRVIRVQRSALPQARSAPSALYATSTQHTRAWGPCCSSSLATAVGPATTISCDRSPIVH